MFLRATDYQDENTSSRYWLENPFIANQDQGYSNARFWFWWNNSLVKLTMYPGEAIELCHSYAHEEGFSSKQVRFEHKGSRVELSTRSGGRDCDGLVWNYRDMECSLDHLKELTSRREGYEDIQIPEWIETDASCYDQYAQMAGY